jgi:hypothetical protein
LSRARRPENFFASRRRRSFFSIALFFAISVSSRFRVCGLSCVGLTAGTEN